jgi:hypothetical protein
VTAWLAAPVAATTPAAMSLRLSSGERALPRRVYARDATVTLHDAVLAEPTGSNGGILRVGVDVYLLAERSAHSGHALVPLDAPTRIGREAAFRWRRDLARFEFPDADPLRRPSLETAARFALSRQPAQLYVGVPANRAVPSADPSAAPDELRGAGLGAPMVPVEQTRLRERLRRESARRAHESLTPGPGAALPAAVWGSGYFQRARRLGPIVGLPGGPQRAGFGRR